MSRAPDRVLDRSASRASGPPRSLLDDDARRQLAARRRRGAIFRWLTFVPVVLATALIVLLFGYVLTSAASWQVLEPEGSGESWGFFEGWRPPFGTFERVVRLELAAQGEGAEGIGELLGDPEEVRRFQARNRVELMWRVDGMPLRWVVTNYRDELVENEDFLVGLAEMEALREAAAEEGRTLRLNPWLDASFLSRNNSGRALVAGFVVALASSLWVIGIVVAVTIPIGIGSAVYLEEYAPNNRFTRFLEVNLRNLAGVPSIVYGILGLYAFVRFARLGPSVLAAALTLALLILPVVVIAAREAIRGVPSSLRQASYGLGATKWQTVRYVVVPNAVSGIVTGVILAVARAIGETAPLLLVGGAGFVSSLPTGPGSSYSVMPTQIYSWVNAPQSAFDNVASAGILVLLAVLIALYVIANWVRRRFERTW